jgi:hypothetical protein
MGTSWDSVEIARPLSGLLASPATLSLKLRAAMPPEVEPVMLLPIESVFDMLRFLPPVYPGVAPPLTRRVLAVLLLVMLAALRRLELELAFELPYVDSEVAEALEEMSARRSDGFCECVCESE